MKSCLHSQFPNTRRNGQSERRGGHVIAPDNRCAEPDVGFLPTIVDMRLSATEMVMHALKELSESMRIPLLPGIGTDHAVNRSLRAGKFLQDHDLRSKVLEDYQRACKLLIEAMTA